MSRCRRDFLVSVLVLYDETRYGYGRVSTDHEPVSGHALDVSGAMNSLVGESMPRRIDRSWIVVDSIESSERNRCVDLFQRRDGTYGFEEFRGDAEDAGGWTPVAYHSGNSYQSREAALIAAARAVAWLVTRTIIS
jgi:hypothetical protein